MAFLYARIPKIHCRQKCQAFCGAVVQLGAYAEAERPEIALALRSAEVVRPAGAALTCQALDLDGRCAIYVARPAICRFWGVTEGMECPHGCEPERMLSQAEMNEILRALEAIAGPGPLAEAKRSLSNPSPDQLIKHLAQTLLSDSQMARDE
ncbi:MAG: YkgJ family cysteine cluster protein [Vulcanimicrobiaceae bacterium]